MLVAIPVSATLPSMPLLFLPLMVFALVVVLVIAVPLSLHMRYHQGRARRRAGVAAADQCVGLLSSVLGFLAMAWLGSRWSENAVLDAAAGLVVGAALGVLGLLLTRLERMDGCLHYTPNRWWVLALTWLVALRIVIGAWTAWHRATVDVGADTAGSQAIDAGGLWAVGGVLLGYATTYAWGLHRRRVATVH